MNAVEVCSLSLQTFIDIHTHFSALNGVVQPFLLEKIDCVLFMYVFLYRFKLLRHTQALCKWRHVSEYGAR